MESPITHGLGHLVGRCPDLTGRVLGLRSVVVFRAEGLFRPYRILPLVVRQAALPRHGGRLQWHGTRCRWRIGRPQVDPRATETRKIVVCVDGKVTYNSTEKDKFPFISS